MRTSVAMDFRELIGKRLHFVVLEIMGNENQLCPDAFIWRMNTVGDHREASVTTLRAVPLDR